LPLEQCLFFICCGKCIWNNVQSFSINVGSAKSLFDLATTFVQL
jgi:hypothetical protein